MRSKTRFLVLIASAPIIAFAVIGGFLGKAAARDDTYQHLRVFEDVVSLIVNNYVEEVDLDKVMHGAMHGLADGLDPDSAYLSREEVQHVESGRQPGPADVGVQLTRQYYLRIVAVRDSSPAARAGLRSGDFIRMIDDRPTRDVSVFEGMRMLHGASGSSVKLTVIRGNAADPRDVPLVRETFSGPDVTSRVLDDGVGYLRIVTFDAKVADGIRAKAAELSRSGVTKLVIDVRSTAGGDLEQGVSSARLFVSSGTLAIRESRGADRESIVAVQGDGAIAFPVAVLVDAGTSGPAELFAAALSAGKRAELIGEKTIGRAAVQKLVKLPDGSGLWLSGARYLTAGGVPIHEKGIEPDVEVEQPDVEFGAATPTTDATLDKALERLSMKKAA